MNIPVTLSLLGLIVLTSSCATRPPRALGPVVSEKEILMTEVNASFSDASVVGPSAQLFQQTPTVPDFQSALGGIDNLVFDNETGNFIMAHRVLFDFNSDKVKETARPSLRAIVDALSPIDGVNLHIIGHTDNIGSETYNNSLSKKRAVAVAEAISNQGFPMSQITTYGEGASSPVASNASEEGRSQNRRVEFRITMK